jgi:hypothetical protein
MRYDHIHWSRINANPIDINMGSLTDNPSKDDGKIVLLGRGSDGFHHVLRGPMTVRQYKKQISS